jgi:cytochrome c-type biogenesis protein CcmF
MVTQGGDGAQMFSMYGQFLYDAITLIGFFLSSFLIVNTGALFVRGVKKRREVSGENVPKALGNLLWKARMQSGGFISHMAMGIIVIGLIGSVMYVRSSTFNVANKPGVSKIKMADYVFTFQGLTSDTLANGDVESVATFDVERSGKRLGSITPSLTKFSVQGQSRHNASVRSEPLRDIFFVLEDMQSEETIPVDIKINPLIWFTWAGFGLLMLGTVLSSWPKKREKA